LRRAATSSIGRFVRSTVPAFSAEALYDRYTSFGEDPFIVAIDGSRPEVEFSGWRYAQERCEAICAECGTATGRS
jgi:hypothetical protein